MPFTCWYKDLIGWAFTTSFWGKMLNPSLPERNNTRNCISLQTKITIASACHNEFIVLKIYAHYVFELKPNRLNHYMKTISF